MREIKFRVWDKKTKKMRSVNSIAFHNENGAFDFDASHTPKVVNVWGKDIIEDKHIILHRESDEVVLMQYTGLKGENGKEIYEGDRIEVTTKKKRGDIKFTNGAFVIDYTDGTSEDLFYLLENNHMAFVVGSIYETAI